MNCIDYKNIKLTRFTPQFWYEVRRAWRVSRGATYVRRYTFIGRSLSLMEFLNLIEGNAILMGLSAFLGGIWAKRIQTKESINLKADIDQKVAELASKNEPKVHVNRVQAEFEYTRYQEIWWQASELSTIASSIDKRLSNTDKLKESVKFYHETRTALGALVNSGYPFIDNDVYEKAHKCQSISCELMSLLHVEEELINQDGLSKINRKEIHQISLAYHNSVKELALAIRNRTQQMTVLETKV
ncbi:Hypothetical protein PBPRA1700 [Photobacterium profundum SS9]|uniref:Uncharacterized protein n=1 Tax=Photobacterium profundum (strain SS9) TaxID=298386 RepID=Q6LRG9_PHOPR|nr:Hypothetical protein PBPRA1700 [Photobacterium profundum SS9]